MTSRREHDAQTAAAAAIARATAHIPPPADDWPEPVPIDARPERYPVTPDIARQIRIETEESRNANPA